MRYCLALIVGIIIGVVSREKYGVPDAVVTCPDIRIPQCPASPACPEISSSNLDTCLKQIAGLMQQNANILDDKEGLASSLARCNSEIDFLQGRVNEPDPEPQEPILFDFNLEPSEE